jgi:hypothetical protein
MPRSTVIRMIVIDKTVIDQINAGNVPLANFIVSQRTHLYMSYDTFSRLNEAEQRLAADLGVDHPNSDEHYIAGFRSGGIKNTYVRQMDPGAFAAIAPEHEATIARAFGGYELMTFDKKLAETYDRLTRHLGDKVVPEMSSIAAVSGPRNYDRGRKILNLKPLNITPSGAVLPTPGVMRATVDGKTVAVYDPQNPEPAIDPVNPARTRGGALTVKTLTRQVGDQLEAPKEYGPSASGDAKFQFAPVAIEGLNYLLQKWNGHIQEKPYIAERDRLEPEIQRRLNDDPQIGVMLFLLFSKGKGDINSAIDTATNFQSIQVAYGFTPDDAVRQYSKIPRTTGPADVGDEVWIKPKAPLDIGRLELPYGTTAAGLATFVPGKEKMVRVAFSGIGGFDDRMFSREEVDVPAGMTPRFCYLWPPKQIRYVDFGRVRTVDVDTTISNEADESVANLGPGRNLYRGIPVVKLDSFINPSTWFSDGATAAMVWPADNRTANLFQTTRATADNNNLLTGQGFGMMRWIRPEFIRVLKDPI